MNTRNPSGDFDAFVENQQRAESEVAPTDWPQERERWLRDLNSLYTQIESFLTKYIDGGTIKLEYDQIELNEENIGSYQARRMLLRIGRQQITLTPIGTLLIGARGRVDVLGPAGRTRLVLVDRDASRPRIKVTVQIAGQPKTPENEKSRKIEWSWKIATNAPSIQYIELTQDSLFQALMEIANG